MTSASPFVVRLDKCNAQVLKAGAFYFYLVIGYWLLIERMICVKTIVLYSLFLIPYSIFISSTVRHFTLAVL